MSRRPTAPAQDGGDDVPVRPAPKLDKLVGQLIAAELRAAGARPDLIDMAGLLVERSVKVEEVDGEAVVTVLDEAGNPRIGDMAGNIMSLPDFVAEMKKGRRAFLFGAPPIPDEGEDKPEAPKTDETATETMARVAREAERASKAAEKRDRDGWVNPWMSGSFNLTRQMTLENLEPARAKAAKAAAGVA